MTAPHFWYSPRSFIGFLKAWILWPFSWLIFGAACLRRFFVSKKKVSVPVICVGNFTAGGAGKTPVTLFIAKYFKQQNKNVAIISRGYLGLQKGPLKVDPALHKALDVGDEPLLMAKDFDVYVAKNRDKAAELAIANGADILIMDDGLQHPRLHQDLKLSVVDSTLQFGNGFMIPAGPLREPLKAALKRVHGFIVINRSESDLIFKPTVKTPLFKVSLHPNTDDWQSLRGKPLVAFAGIGHPEKFKQTLLNAGLNLKDFVPFPDHHPYHEKDLKSLLHLAEKQGAKLVTTAKDFVKLPPQFQAKTTALRVTLEFETQDPFYRFLDHHLHPFFNPKKK